MHGQQDFEAGSAAFIEWFSETAESANISPKIAFADLRDTGAGRGVGK